MRTFVLLSTLLLLCNCLASAGTIADAVAQPVGTAVTIDDALILSTVDLEADADYRSFQLRDMTRAITVYGTNAEIEAALAGWAAGDGINITAGIGKLRGVMDTIEPLLPVGGSVGGFAVTGRTSLLPFPFPTNAKIVGPLDIGHLYESDLVCLQNVSFLSGGTFAGESSYSLGGVSTIVRIATADLNLVGQLIPTGPVNITGIVLPDLDGDGYYLAPRGMSDIVLVPEPATMLLLAVGGLLLKKQKVHC